MAAIVVRVDQSRSVCSDGDYWYAVDVCDLATKTISEAHKCSLDDIEFEIIDGPSVKTESGLTCWWERPKQKASA